MTSAALVARVVDLVSRHSAPTVVDPLRSLAESLGERKHLLERKLFESVWMPSSERVMASDGGQVHQEYAEQGRQGRVDFLVGSDVVKMLALMNMHRSALVVSVRYDLAWAASAIYALA